jgi:hypothetical protein
MAAKRRAQTCDLTQIPIPSSSDFKATGPKVHYEYFVRMMKERNKAVKNWDLIHSYYKEYQSRDKNVADVDSERRKRMKLADPELKVPFYRPSAAVFGSEDDASNDMVQIFELTGRYGGSWRHQTRKLARAVTKMYDGKAAPLFVKELGGKKLFGPVTLMYQVIEAEPAFN